jgi:hypothetical protein
MKQDRQRKGVGDLRVSVSTAAHKNRNGARRRK